MHVLVLCLAACLLSVNPAYLIALCFECGEEGQAWGAYVTG